MKDSQRKRVDGLSEELSSEEEEVEIAGQPRDLLIPNTQTKPASGLRKRLQNATDSAASTKHQVRTADFAQSTCVSVVHVVASYFCCVPQQVHDDGSTTITTASPPDMKPGKASEESRPASDSDDMLWEEFLQGSDSASSVSSESGDEGLHSHNHTLPPPTVLSSDDDKTFSQVSFM